MELERNLELLRNSPQVQPLKGSSPGNQQHLGMKLLGYITPRYIYYIPISLFIDGTGSESWGEEFFSNPSTPDVPWTLKFPSNTRIGRWFGDSAKEISPIGSLLGDSSMETLPSGSSMETSYFGPSSIYGYHREYTLTVTR